MSFNKNWNIIKFYSKKVLKNLLNIKAVECVSVALAAGSIVIVTSLIFDGRKPVENGQGGFETPGIPVVTEKDLGEAASDGIAPMVQTDLSYQSYRVRKGDMIGIIAENFGITEDTIISVNNIRSSRLLQIGTYLKIPSLPGILYTVRKDGETVESISNKYKIDGFKVCNVNKIDESSVLTAGTMLFLPDAKLDWTTRQEINGDLFKKPIHNRWYLSSAYGWRKSPFSGARSYHSGVDMACPQGTKIFAAMAGTVSSTGFNNTYGNFVIITHHSGYKTLYGHMSAINAVKGQSVTQDTVIGRVGNTGLSTGPHLHFTVLKNGKQVNPAALWN